MTCKPSLCKIADWIGGWAVAGLAGALFSFVVTYCAPAPRSIDLRPNDLGITQPSILFEQARTEGKLDFQPAELKDAKVCDYRLVRAKNSWELLMTYLQTYSACFVTIEDDNRSVKVLPNTNSTLLTVENGSYYCMCAPATISSDQKRIQPSP